MTALWVKALMWVDALLCFKLPRLARYRIVVLDRLDGAEHDVAAARFRWGRSASAWIVHANAHYVRDDMAVCFSIRRVQ